MIKSVEKENKYIIYVHENKINGKKYIGQTSKSLERRSRANGIGYHHNQYFKEEIEKYGWDNFNHIVLFENLDSDIADEIEKSLIAKYNTMDERYGYNIQSGGKATVGIKYNKSHCKNISERMMGVKNPMYGRNYTDEERKIVSKRFKGTKQTIEHIEKRKMYGAKNPMYGKKVSEETRKKISLAGMGRKPSLDTRRKLSRTKQGKLNSLACGCYLINPKDNSVIEFETITSAYRYVGKTVPNKNIRLKGTYDKNNNHVYILKENEYREWKLYNAFFYDNREGDK